MQEIIYIINNQKSFDWNPLATIGGTILTTIATVAAVYFTSKEDRKAREFDNKYNYYLDNLVKLRNCVSQIMDYNRKYIQIGDGDAHTISYTEVIDTINMLEKTKQFLDAVKTYSVKNIKDFNNFEDLVDKYIDMFKTIRCTLKIFIDRNLQNDGYYSKAEGEIIIKHLDFQKQYDFEYSPKTMNEKILVKTEKIINDKLKLD